MGEKVRGSVSGTGLPAGCGLGSPVERAVEFFVAEAEWAARLLGSRFPLADEAQPGREGRLAAGARFVQPCLEWQLIPFHFCVLFQTQYIPVFSSSCYWRTNLWGGHFAGPAQL